MARGRRGSLIISFSLVVPLRLIVTAPALIAMASAVLLILVLVLIEQMHAAPISPYPAIGTSYLAEVSSRSPACNDINNCRTLWGIIYSCIVTTFACTWVSYHPDVPDRTHTPWRIRATRFFTVVFPFLVPELTIAKAASQCWRVWEYKFPFQGTF